MEIIRGTHNIRPAHHGCALAIGNFDGVHLGHQQLLQKLCDKAKALGVPSTLIIFEPQPQEYFNREAPPPRLSRFHEKIMLIREHSQLDRVLCLPFNAALAGRLAEDIVLQLLVGQLGAVYVLVGDDFRFGAGRTGSIKTLQAAAAESHFQVEHLHSVRRNDQRVSSSLIRAHLMQGDLAGAERLLGHGYALLGRVVRGRQLGRTLGVPTANIHFKHFMPPLRGVYAVAVEADDRSQYFGVANLGTKPTLAGERLLLEVHLFGFDGGLYGRKLKVHFRRKVRDEQRFDGVEALKAQIAKDVACVQRWEAEGALHP